MEMSPKQFRVKVVDPETIPPTKMIGYDEQGELFIEIHSINFYLMEMPLYFPNSVVFKKSSYNNMVRGFYHTTNRYLYVTMPAKNRTWQMRMVTASGFFIGALFCLIII